MRIARCARHCPTRSTDDPVEESMLNGEKNLLVVQTFSSLLLLNIHFFIILPVIYIVFAKAD